MADGGTEKAARVTIRTVAGHAGVSVAAVSKVLRNAYGVSDSLRGKVENSIATLGYRPSVAARGMRGQTFTWGVLLVGIDNPFLPTIYEGIQGVADASGYKIMVGVGAARTRTEVSLIEQMIDNRMDGIILVASQMAGPILEGHARQIPTVVVGHHEDKPISFDTINSNDRLGAEMAVRELVARGYSDIAMVSLGEPQKHIADVSPKREQGYLAAMADAGLSGQARILHFPQPEVARKHLIRDMLGRADRPRAIFCWSDLDAIPIVGVAFEMGLRIPQDLAIIGYDNSPTAALPQISLTSIDQHGQELGRLAAEALLSRVEGRQTPVQVMVDPTMVLRGSI